MPIQTMSIHVTNPQQCDDKAMTLDDDDRISLLPPSGIYTGVVDSVDNGRWTLRYDALGLEHSVTSAVLQNILRISGCHEGGHLWTGKHVLVEEDGCDWEGEVEFFCPGRLNRQKILLKTLGKRERNKLKMAKSVHSRTVVKVHADVPYFWRVKFEYGGEIYYEVCNRLPTHD